MIINQNILPEGKLFRQKVNYFVIEWIISVRKWIFCQKVSYFVRKWIISTNMWINLPESELRSPEVNYFLSESEVFFVRKWIILPESGPWANIPKQRSTSRVFQLVCSSQGSNSYNKTRINLRLSSQNTNIALQFWGQKVNYFQEIYYFFKKVHYLSRKCIIYQKGKLFIKKVHYFP